MIEVEVKLPIYDPDNLTEKLSALAFTRGTTIRECDTYFDGNLRPIRMAGEALRIRTIEYLAGQPIPEQERSVQITFKGRLIDTLSMTRQELETEVADPAVMESLLMALGFHPVEPRVIKQRTEYHKDNMNACMDFVEGLGFFLELEIVIEEDQSKEGALEKIEEMLGKLGYSMEDTVRNSYLSMLMGISDLECSQ